MFIITLKGAPLALACDDAAALVLWGLKHLTSIPALSITLFTHLEIVARATPLKGACVEMNSCVSWLLKLDVLSIYSRNSETMHNDLFWIYDWNLILSWCTPGLVCLSTTENCNSKLSSWNMTSSTFNKWILWPLWPVRSKSSIQTFWESWSKVRFELKLDK